jgi:hypothetical protein
MADVSDYMEEGSQRIYAFTPEQAWVNHSEKRGGVVVRDNRYEIALTELVASSK